MLKSTFCVRAVSIALIALSSSDVWATAVLPPRLPGPGVLGLVAAAVIGAIGVSRSRR
jgi:hypothetical protein